MSTTQNENPSAGSTKICHSW